MKYLFPINACIVVFNLVLLIEPFFALWYAMITGGIQLIMTIIMAFYLGRFDLTSKKLYFTYALICTLFFASWPVEEYWRKSELFTNILMCTPIFLAFLHLYITFRVKKLPWN